MIKFSVIAPNATYDLVRNTAGVNEGSSFSITLNTTGVQQGQVIPYTITGIQQADISEPLTGSFVIQNGQANKTFNVVADSLTEGTEVFTMTLDGVGTNVNVTVNDTSVAGDPYWANVMLLTHFDANDSQFVNEASRGTVYNNSSFTTQRSKFGSGSSVLSNASSIQYNALETLGTSSFTIEFFAYISANGPNGAMLTSAGTSSNPGIVIARSLVFAGTGGNALIIPNSSGYFNLNEWVHIALVRNGTTLMLFANGNMVGSRSNVTTNLTTTTYVTSRLYTDSSGESVSGYIDELRITKGVARYTTDFTPPTAPFLNA